MEENHVDPYAPPKAALTGTDKSTFLDQDGYKQNNELVANEHFKSPLICAKLGTPIPAETNPEPKEITVTRVPKISQSIIAPVTLFSFILLIFCSAYMGFSKASPIIVGYFIAAAVFKRFLFRPYQIPFYLSEQYTRKRTRRIFTLTTIFLIFIVTAVIAIVTNEGEYAIVSIPAAFLTIIVLKFKTTYFIVTKTKGEFHYIRGAHPNLLTALPDLPVKF